MTRHAKKRRSLFRRLVYFVVMVMTGGSAGIGGWFFKDYPQLKTLTEAVLGRSVDELGEGEAGVLKERLATAVSEVLTRDPRRPGVYKVRIASVELDPKRFTQGRTVDIQAQVRKIDADGRSVVVWESKTYGENLAVVGRDDLSAGWDKRPFDIAWRPGDQVVVEVWDRKAGFFSPKTFKMAVPEPDAFPLATGPHSLTIASSRSSTESSLNRIVFDSQRIGDAPDRSLLENKGSGGSIVERKGPGRAPVDVAERPIVIK